MMMAMVSKRKKFQKAAGNTSMWLRGVGAGNKQTESHLAEVIIEAVGMDKITKGADVELERPGDMPTCSAGERRENHE